MRNLDFLVGEFNEGENVTVRLGYKWRDTVVGGSYPITVKGVAIGKVATVVEFSVKPFERITQAELDKEHDPSCHKMSGLVGAMLDAYPNFVVEDVVVVLHFIVEEVQ